MSTLVGRAMLRRAPGYALVEDQIDENHNDRRYPEYPGEKIFSHGVFSL